MYCEAWTQGVHVWVWVRVGGRLLLLEQMAGWYSYIFQFQSMQFESGRTSNNGEWLYTPTGCPPPRVL